MKASLQMKLLVLVSAALVAAGLGLQLAAPTAALVPAKPVAAAQPASVSAAPQQTVAPLESSTRDWSSATLSELSAAWRAGAPLSELEPIATVLAERNTADSAQALLDGLALTHDWPTRSALAKNLRSLSDPETLQALLPALLNTYGRGNTILNEISDAIGRMAQPETIEDLAALHWQASTQAGQGHKVLRTVACIRNPAAMRGLERLVNRSDSPALAAAAMEALKAMKTDLKLQASTFK